MSLNLYSFLDRILWRYWTYFNHSLDKRQLPFSYIYNGPDADTPQIRNDNLSFEPGELLTLAGDRYRVERKLRGRATSMVWLAEHSVKASSQKRFVAIETYGAKLTASIARQRTDDPREATRNYIHNMILDQARRVPGSLSCERARSVHFGKHICIVKDVCGPTLNTLLNIQPDRRFPLSVTKSIIRETLLALQYIHSTGRTHVGVNEHNISVVPKGNAAQSVSAGITEFLEKNPPSIYIPANTGRSRRRRNIALNIAQPLPVLGLTPTLDNLTVRLGRCEHSTLPKYASQSSDKFDLLQYLYALPKFCSPEAYTGATPQCWASPVNIWAVGHLAFYCLSGQLVFPWLSSFPLTATPAWGELEDLCNPASLFLRRRLWSVPAVKREMSDRQFDATCAFLARCFEIDPDKRATAQALLEDEWFGS